MVLGGAMSTGIRSRRPPMLVKFVLHLLSLHFCSITLCLGQTNPPEGKWSVSNPPPDENPRFFPEGTFARDRPRMAKTYSWYLRSMGEVPLRDCPRAKSVQVYRAVVLAPYRSPVVVRLSVEPMGDAELVVKVGESYKNPSTLTVGKNARLSDSETRSFFSLLDHAEFWSMPTQRPLNIGSRDCKALLGDTAWMLGALRVSENQYHVVHRGASEGDAFKDLMLEFVERLAKVDLRSLPRTDWVIERK
jgi:hypothetical protein